MSVRLQPVPVTVQKPGGGADVGTGVAAPPAPTYKSRFESSVHEPENASRVASSSRSEVTFSPKINAAAPLACGHAIDVPDKVAVPEPLVWERDTTPDPGAHMPVHVP